MQRSLLVFFFIVIAATTKASDSAYIITGRLTNVKSGIMYLYIFGDGTKKDSAKINNGKFSFKGYTKAPASAMLDLKDDRQDYFRFYIEPARIVITGTGDSLGLLEVKGSAVNDDDKILKSRLQAVTRWEESLDKPYGEALKANNKAVTDSIDDVLEIILKEKRKIIAGFVKDYPHSMRSAMAITENYAYYAEADEVEPLYAMLDNDLKNSAKGIAIKKMIDVYRTVAIGKIPPDFTESTPDGKSITLSS